MVFALVMTDVYVIKADLDSPIHAAAVVELLNLYATDPLGGSEELSDYCKSNLVNELKKRPSAHVFFAVLGENFVGLANCFEGFSSFKCKTLLNIHDFYVHKDYRRLGISQKLMAGVEKFAVENLGCCKLTLEVLEGNFAARGSYERCGFEKYVLDEKYGGAIFMHKCLNH